MNNKMIKGSIAGATGVALLMGGFGTYALWSDSESMSPAQVTSGTLDVAAGTVSWTDQNGPWTAASDLMVPGDTVTRTQNFTFSGTGKNLAGAMVFTPGSETERSNPAGGGSAVDALTIDVDVTGVTLTEVSPNCWEFTVTDVAQTAVTTVEFDLDADNTDLQNVTASITGSTFSITQDATC